MRNISPGWLIPHHPCHQSLCGVSPCRPVFILDSLSVTPLHSQQVSHISTNSCLSSMAPKESFYCGVNTLLHTASVVEMCTFVFKHFTAHLSTIQLQQTHQLNILSEKFFLPESTYVSSFSSFR